MHTDAFPASAAFDAINQALTDEAERKDAIKKAAGIYAFTLTNAAGKEASWYIDLKTTGKVGKGAAPPGGKADVTLITSEENFQNLVTGKANAQRLFMGGKLKIKGNVMKATKLDPVLKKAQTKAKL
ncbi:fatty acid-binding protein [Talaromyces proteolyticus]|uniref:Fatty acid-binding protein n=1 Tax=Talaromyces proteolyticus TaxID=1131652 RepID=A0AAD4KUT6_9EURO|nr:fatty acid-binding protein [Talaromyces proteolyticus]KAH8701622.1 fatty acid-binding protein [Talaromyces proteolyticus]